MSGGDNVVWLDTPRFPEAARAALADTRLREPAPGHRHHPGPRLVVTAELDDGGVPL
ncbi:hypothetical protein [Streptomyces sp. NPDC091219]|uniref:hypothetical protein n=1 Tax=Streptomyces sp. NPDC091219 TaxID=3155193 RepID=UPI00344B756C